MLAKEVLDLNVFLALDYSQLEIRFLALASRDPLLCKQLNEGRDIHCLVGNLLTGASFDDIKNDEALRRSVKEFHFSLVYGVSKASMHRHLVGKGVKITEKRAAQYYDRYFQYYKGVARFMERMRAFVETRGYVETIFGFRRDIRKTDDSRSTFWGNQAVNSPIQGGAHQLILIAMALLKLKPITYALLDWRTRILLEVHDALYFRLPLHDLLAAFKLAEKLLQRDVVDYSMKHFSIDIDIPLLAEAKAGFCMGSMVKYGGESPQDFLKVWRKKHLEIEARPISSLLPELKFGQN